MTSSVDAPLNAPEIAVPADAASAPSIAVPDAVEIEDFGPFSDMDVERIEIAPPEDDDSDDIVPEIDLDTRRSMLAVCRQNLRDRKAARDTGDRPAGLGFGMWLGDFCNQDTESGLHLAEERLLHSVMMGLPCRLRRTKPETRDDLSALTEEDLKKTAWKEKTPVIVRGTFIRFLILGIDATIPRVERLTLVGAWIDGDIVLEHGRNIGALQFRHCHIDGNVSVDHAEIASLSLKGSELAKLDGRGTKILGPLVLKQATVRDGVFLDQSHVRSTIDMTGAHLFPREGTENIRAVSADNAQVDGDVYFGEASRVYADADFFGAHIGGMLALYECVFLTDKLTHGVSKTAGLRANSTVIDGGFGAIKSKIQSGVFVTSSRISRIATFSATMVGEFSGYCVSFRNSRIESEVVVKDRCSFHGTFNFGDVDLTGDFSVSQCVFNAQAEECTRVAFDFLGTKVGGSFFLINDSTINGAARFSNSTFGKDFVIRDTKLHNRSFSAMGVALHGLDVSVDSGVVIGPNVAAVGEVLLRGLKTGSQFSVISSRFTAREGGVARNALICEMVDVGSILNISGSSEFDGLVSFAGGRVGSEFQIYNSRFAAVRDDEVLDALRCVGMEIKSGVFISQKSEFKGEVDFSSTVIHEGFVLSNSRIWNQRYNLSSAALNLYNSEIGRDLNIHSDAVLEGALNASGLQVDGSIYFNNMMISNGREGYASIAFSLVGARVKGNVTLSPNVKVSGGLDFTNLGIDRQLNLNGICVVNQTADGNGKAIDCERIRVGSHIFMSGGFHAEGQVDLRGSDVAADLILIDGTFSNLTQNSSSGSGRGRTSANYALELSSARIGNFLWLGPAIAPNDQQVCIEGSLNLSGAHAHILIDDPVSWPGGAHSKTMFDASGKALQCNIGLDGFTYGRFGRAKMANWKVRKAWLERQNDEARFDDFRPQPYEYLATVLRGMGHARDAREISKLRQSAERKATVRRELKNRPAQAIGAQLERLFYGGLAGYGYAFKRLLAMVFLLWGLGAVVYSAAEEQGLIAPADAVVFTNPDLRQSCAVSWTRCKDLPREHSAFDARIYAIDVMVPIVSLGMEDDWSVVDLHNVEMVGRSPQQRFELSLGRNTWTTPTWFLRAIYWTQVILGWVLSGLLLAVLSGFMKQD
ncbi:MAG: hypothetical protein AAGJ70_06125 [Pseudomonadota bacterium]